MLITECNNASLAQNKVTEDDADFLYAELLNMYSRSCNFVSTNVLDYENFADLELLKRLQRM